MARYVIHYTTQDNGRNSKLACGKRVINVSRNRMTCNEYTTDATKVTCKRCNPTQPQPEPAMSYSDSRMQERKHNGETVYVTTIPIVSLFDRTSRQFMSADPVEVALALASHDMIMSQS